MKQIWFADYNAAKLRMEQRIKAENESGLLKTWKANAKYQEDCLGDSFEAWIDGFYTSDHFCLCIQKKFFASADRKEVCKLWYGGISMRTYTNPEANGFLMEAKACAKIEKDLQRLIEKYAKAIKREEAARQRTFETVMQYRHRRRDTG